MLAISIDGMKKHGGTPTEDDHSCPECGILNSSCMRGIREIPVEAARDKIAHLAISVSDY